MTACRFGADSRLDTIKDANVVVISYGFWQRLGGDQTVIGRTLYLNGWPYSVAGVLPQGVYSMLAPLVSPSLYVPLGPRVNRGLENRSAAQFDVVGRSLNGMTRPDALRPSPWSPRISSGDFRTTTQG